MKNNNYKILMNGDWSLEDLYIMPHIYLQVYAFIYSLHITIKDCDDETDRLVITYSAHPWRGGYSTVNFYNNLKFVVPRNHRPKIKSIRYASPGWIELTLVVSVALNIKKIISCFCHSGNELNILYQNIYKGMHERKMMGLEAKRQSLKLSEEHIAFVIESASKLSELLGLSDIKQISNLTKNPLATLKILLSLYRKIKKLANFEKIKKANF